MFVTIERVTGYPMESIKMGVYHAIPFLLCIAMFSASVLRARAIYASEEEYETTPRRKKVADSDDDDDADFRRRRSTPAPGYDPSPTVPYRPLPSLPRPESFELNRSVTNRLPPLGVGEGRATPDSVPTVIYAQRDNLPKTQPGFPPPTKWGVMDYARAKVPEDWSPNNRRLRGRAAIIKEYGVAPGAALAFEGKLVHLRMASPDNSLRHFATPSGVTTRDELLDWVESQLTFSVEHAE
jgi:hypothetical protein